MWVLIINCAMRSRSETEVVTLELALGLLRRGHEVAVLTALIGRPPPFSGTKGSWSPIARKSFGSRPTPSVATTCSIEHYVRRLCCLASVRHFFGRTERAAQRDRLPESS
ncbi:MAG: hypothetical protein ACLPWG_14945 [Steroidobacteraceae bacterium]|jgi:hypothetical protein